MFSYRLFKNLVENLSTLINIVSKVLFTFEDVPDDTLLEGVYGWVKFGGATSKAKIVGGKVQTQSGSSTPYYHQTYNDVNRYAEAILLDVTTQQGYICPIIIDENDYVGTTYVVSTGRLSAAKMLNGSYTELGNVARTVVSGNKIGGVVYNGSYYITHNSVVVAGPCTI
jgi:hypothetical protein